MALYWTYKMRKNAKPYARGINFLSPHMEFINQLAGTKLLLRDGQNLATRYFENNAMSRAEKYCQLVEQDLDEMEAFVMELLKANLLLLNFIVKNDDYGNFVSFDDNAIFTSLFSIIFADGIDSEIVQDWKEIVLTLACLHFEEK